MATPKVSICLTTYNRSDLVEKSINNVLLQTHSNFELFVIDDFSEPDQQAEIKIIENKLCDSRIQFIFNEENKGLAFNRNLAISLSSGVYFTFKDDDDEWDAEFLLEMIEVMNTGSTLPMVAVAGYVNKNTGKSYCYLEHNSTMYDCFINGFTPPVGGQFYCLELIKAIGGYSSVKTGVDHDLWVNIVAEKPDTVVSFIPKSLVTPDAFLTTNNEKMTTNFSKRTKGISDSLIAWEEKLKHRFSSEFFLHFSSEYSFYLCHRFMTFAIKNRDIKLLFSILRSRKLSPHIFAAMIYLFKQLLIRRFHNQFELRPLFRRYRGDK